MSNTIKYTLWLSVILGALAFLSLFIYEEQQNNAAMSQNQFLLEESIQRKLSVLIEREMESIPFEQLTESETWSNRFYNMIWVKSGRILYPWLKLGGVDNTPNVNPDDYNFKCDWLSASVINDAKPLDDVIKLAGKGIGENVVERRYLVSETIRSVGSVKPEQLKNNLELLLQHRYYHLLNDKDELESNYCFLNHPNSSKLSVELLNQFFVKGFSANNRYIPSFIHMLFSQAGRMSNTQYEFFLQWFFKRSEMVNFDLSVISQYASMVSKNDFSALSPWEIDAHYLHDLHLDAELSNSDSNQTDSMSTNYILRKVIFRGQDIVFVKSRDEQVYFLGMVDDIIESLNAEFKKLGMLKTNDWIKIVGNAETNSIHSFGIEVFRQSVVDVKGQRKLIFLIKIGLLVLIVILALFLIRMQQIKIARKQRFLQLKEEFVTLVSHELKTPLASIKLMAETLLKRHEKKLSINDYPKRLLNETNALQELLNNLLLLNRLKAGVEDFSKKEVSLINCIQDEVETLKHHYSFTINVDVCERQSIFVNQGLFKLLLRNLFINAITYCDKESPLLTVRYNESESILIITDNACGIEEDKFQQVFELFYRNNQKVSGSGVGLNLCREIMCLHGGSLNVEASSSEGTIWHVVFK